MPPITIPSTSRGPKLLEEMTYTEVADALTRTNVAIFTPSAVEQHGAHLPLGTDWYIGIETTRRTLAKLAEKGHEAVGYAFPLGKSDGFLNFPGSLTLSNQTFVTVQKEICASLYHQGFRRFVFLSGNGGNGTVMQVAADEVHRELDVPVIYIDPLPFQWSYRDGLLNNPKIDHHGAEGETSKIMTSNPDLVHIDRAGHVDPLTHARPLPNGVRRFAGKWEDMAPGGVVGNPTLAEAKNGEVMYDKNAEWIAGVIIEEFFTDRSASA